MKTVITGGGAEGFTVEVVNLPEVLAAFGEMADMLAEAATEAAEAEAHYELPITKQLVPIATGQLHDSGRVEGVERGWDATTVGIAYGGPAGSGDNTKDVDYALIVHEDLNAKHFNIHETPKGLVITRGGAMGRGAKYVERVVRAELESGRAAERMGAIIRARMGWL